MNKEDKININKEVVKDSIKVMKSATENLNKIYEDLLFYRDRLKNVSEAEAKEYLGEDLFNEVFKTVEDLSNAIDKINNL